MKFLYSLLLLQAVLALRKPSKTCTPTRYYITATRTTVAVEHEYLTKLHPQESYEELPITLPHVARPVRYETVLVTASAEPLMVVETLYLTDISYRTSLTTALATAVVTDTLRLYLTDVSVVERTLTQTKVTEEVVTNTLTHVSLTMLPRTKVVTETDLTYVTRTILVTGASRGADEQIVTVFQGQVDVTVTVTDSTSVSSCYDSKVSYSH